MYEGDAPIFHRQRRVDWNLTVSTPRKPVDRKLVETPVTPLVQVPEAPPPPELYDVFD
jgi:hypothetical protein